MGHIVGLGRSSTLFMGYDFMFMSLRDAEQKKFPLEFSDFDQTDWGDDLPWPQFREWLLNQGGRENGGESSIWVNYPEESSINFHGSHLSIFLDTHASWDNVLSAYLFLKSLHPNARVHDCQTGAFYDEPTFRELIAGKTTLTNNSPQNFDLKSEI
jgi:hypothetical protein